MDAQQRHREPQDPAPITSAPSGGGALPGLRQQAADLAAAADAIIASALSQDSEAFLQANRQQGGE